MPGRPPSHSLFRSASCSTAKSTPKFSLKPSHARRFATSAARQTTATVSPRVVAPTSTPSVDYAWKRQVSDLQQALSEHSSPSHVWASYTNLLNFSGFQMLPLEVHQEVLRKCTISTQQLRVAAARRIIAGNIPNVPHIHESKFQVIIRNIRASGHIPALDDYHFILDQFAAVGNYPGSIQVYEEAKSLNHTPTAKTIGFILQAIAHRLTLPITKYARPRIIEQTRKIYNGLLEDMRIYNIPLVSANMDLSFRIMKENLDIEAFNTLMRWAYGIDMAYPDRVPLELLEKKHIPGDDPAGQVPVPFSTHALNTAIDFLGSTGNISKMMQAFEVLTQPLPRAQDHFFSTFEDDEDDVGAVLKTPYSSFTLPYAEPNTTTYTTLIRHVSRAGKQTLARHYLNEAMWLDRKVVISLRHGTWMKPDSMLLQPNFSLNRDMLLSVLGISNTHKHLSLLRWLARRVSRLIGKKKADLEYHILRSAHLARINQRNQTSSPNPPSITDSEDARLSKDIPNPIFDLDFDTSVPQQVKRKTFDSALHIRILEKDVRDLEAFEKRLVNVLGRTSQRVKERLGRRVWADKDIFLSTARARIIVSKDKWRSIVNFKPIKYISSRSFSRSSHPRFFGASSTKTLQPPLYVRRRTFATVFVGPLSSARIPSHLPPRWWAPPRNTQPTKRPS